MRAIILAPFCLAFVALGGTLAAAGPATPHFPTNEDLRHLGSIGSPVLSPDGKSVLLQVQESTADGAKSHIWIVDVAADTARQLTFSTGADKRGEYSASWMPDGKSILFLAHRGEQTQLFQLPMAGGEAKAFDLKTMPIADRSKLPGALPPAGDEAAKTDAPSTKTSDTKGESLPLDISSYAVAPDSKAIAIVADDPETPGEKKQGEEKVDATWVDHEIHGTRLYVFDTGTSKLNVTAVPLDVHSVSWSRDSSKLLALTEEPHNMGDLRPATAAYLLLTANSSQVVKLDSIPPTVDSAAWAIDGKSIALLAQAKEDAPPGYADLYQYDLAAMQLVDRSEGVSGSINGGEPLALLDGSLLQGIAQGVDGTFGIFTGKQPEVLRMGVPVAGSLHTNAQQTGWVFLGQAGSQPAALYYTASLHQPARMLHTPPVAPEALNAVAPSRLHWKNDGLLLEGLLYLPPQAGTAKVPLVVDVHGGPLGAFEDRYDPFVQFLVGQGWAVLRVNPRGSSNYGARFAAANKNDLGGGDYRDIMSGVDFALKTQNLDPARTALIGYSYGGEMAAFVEGQTARFKAIVSAAPVIDQFSEYGTESSSWYDRWYFGKPWEHQKDAWRQSPLARAGYAVTPFLLLQGADDRQTPSGNRRKCTERCGKQEFRLTW